MMPAMRYRTLGDSGLLVSVAGLGCNNFGGRIDLQRTRAVVDAAIDAGITLFDTAEMYGKDGGSELALGEVLAGRRDKVVLATKFGHQKVDMGYGPAAGAKGGRGYIRLAVEKSLRGAQRGVSILEIAIGGLAAQPGCASVIAGATSAEQIVANAAAGEWEPTPEDLAGLDKISPPPARES